MKKILLLSLMLVLSITIQAQISRAFGIQTGYSRLNGLVGVEYQMGYISIGAGYFPTQIIGETRPSFSGSITAYGGNWNKTCLYISLGVSSEGFAGGHVPINILMGGAKIPFNSNWYFKTGVGVGWSGETTKFTGEISFGYQFNWK